MLLQLIWLLPVDAEKQWLNTQNYFRTKDDERKERTLPQEVSVRPSLSFCKPANREPSVLAPRLLVARERYLTNGWVRVGSCTLQSSLISLAFFYLYTSDSLWCIINISLLCKFNQLCQISLFESKNSINGEFFHLFFVILCDNWFWFFFKCWRWVFIIWLCKYVGNINAHIFLIREIQQIAVHTLHTIQWHDVSYPNLVK